MPEQSAISSIGLGQAVSLSNAGIDMGVGFFRLGSGSGYTPTAGQSSFSGSVVYPSTGYAAITSTQRISDLELEYRILLDRDIGNFDFGEICLYMDDVDSDGNNLYTPLIWVVRDSAFSKTATAGTVAGNTYQLNARMNFDANLLTLTTAGPAAPSGVRRVIHDKLSIDVNNIAAGDLTSILTVDWNPSASGVRLEIRGHFTGCSTILDNTSGGSSPQPAGLVGLRKNVDSAGYTDLSGSSGTSMSVFGTVYGRTSGEIDRTPQGVDLSYVDTSTSTATHRYNLCVAPYNRTGSDSDHTESGGSAGSIDGRVYVNRGHEQFPQVGNGVTWLEVAEFRPDGTVTSTTVTAADSE